MNSDKITTAPLKDTVRTPNEAPAVETTSQPQNTPGGEIQSEPDEGPASTPKGHDPSPTTATSENKPEHIKENGSPDTSSKTPPTSTPGTSQAQPGGWGLGSLLNLGGAAVSSLGECV